MAKITDTKITLELSFKEATVLHEVLGKLAGKDYPDDEAHTAGSDVWDVLDNILPDTE